MTVENSCSGDICTNSARIREHQNINGRRNYIIHTVEGGMYMSGMTFIAVETVLPVIASALGGPKYLMPFIPISLILGFTIPPLFTAHLVEKLHRMKQFCLITGFLQRIPYLIAGLALLLLPDKAMMLCLAIVLVAPIFSGLSCGFSIGAWQELLARTVRKNRMSSLFALRNTIRSLVGIGAGVVVAWTLSSFPGRQGFGLLHLFAFSFMFISYVLFSLIREPRVDNESAGRLSFVENIKSIVIMLRGDSNAAYLLLSQFFSGGIFIILGFVTLNALHITRMGDLFLGWLLGAQMVGDITGNILVGYFGDKYGPRLPTLAGRLLLCIVAGCFILAFSSWHFTVLFFLLGSGLAMNGIGGFALVFEISPPGRLPTYSSAVFMASAAGTLLAGTIGSVLSELKFFFMYQGVATMIILLLSFLCLCRIKPKKSI